MNRFLSIALCGFLAGHHLMAAEVPALPGNGHDASRYQSLWAKSPFMTESKEETPASSDYTLLGLGRCDGISYAVVTDNQNKETFLLRTGETEHGLLLASVTGGRNISNPLATIQKNGQFFALHFDPSVHLPNASLVVARVGPSNLPTPGSANPSQLTPPKGVSLPLVFQPIDSSKLDLSDDQKAILARLRQQFIEAVGENGKSNAIAANSPDAGNTAANTSGAPSPLNQTPGQTTSVNKWKTAQNQSDDLFKMQFGYEAFNQYQMALSHQGSP